MIPIRNTHKTNLIPFVNYAIIAINIVIFLFQFTLSDTLGFINTYGFTPSSFSLLVPSTYITVFTSMWLHGGIFHILSNMWFLHIFGDNIEDELGHAKYFLFYITAGFASVFAQYLFSTQSIIPLIGASGAISGVTGAYFVFFKHSKIQALVPSFIGFWHMVKLPSSIFLGYWFIIQIFSGVGSFATTQSSEGGVAFFAHIGGFIFGYVFAKLFYTYNKPKEEILKQVYWN